MKRSKRYTAIEKARGEFEPKEAIDTVKKAVSAKFDESIDVAFNLNLLKKHTIRDTVVFPNSFGKQARVLVFAKGQKAEEAKAAGADYVGDDDLIQKIADGWLEFDVAIATPDMMKNIAKIARTLGTKGLMPNPKARTVTDDVKGAVKEVKAGRREFRADSNGIINFAIGKAGMEIDSILQNLNELYNNILKKKPTDLKGDYIKSIHVTSTMGKSVAINKKSIGK